MNRLAVLAIALLPLAGCSGSPVQAPLRQPAHVSSVTVAVDGPRAAVEVAGSRGACDTILPPVQRREGGAVTVTVHVDTAPGACILRLDSWSQHVVLDGSFAPGDYVVEVNGVATGFTVR
jgi:hypothetical protein